MNLEKAYFGVYDGVWYVPTEGSDSGFRGIAVGRICDFDTTGGFPPFSRIIVKCAMQGFGDFEGQTLKFSVDSDLFACKTWTGYCIK